MRDLLLKLPRKVSTWTEKCINLTTFSRPFCICRQDTALLPAVLDVVCFPSFSHTYVRAYFHISFLFSYPPFYISYILNILQIYSLRVTTRFTRFESAYGAFRGAVHVFVFVTSLSVQRRTERCSPLAKSTRRKVSRRGHYITPSVSDAARIRGV